MAKEHEIIERFVAQFPFLESRMSSPRPQRIFTAGMSREEFAEVLDYARLTAGFTKMHHVVGTDEGADLGFLYVMENGEGVLLVLRTSAPKSDPVIRSLTPVFPGIEWHERELADLFGAKVEGLPDGPRYPLPDGWPEGNYPMRKDWDPNRFDRDTMTYREAGEGEAKP